MSDRYKKGSDAFISLIKTETDTKLLEAEAKLSKLWSSLPNPMLTLFKRLVPTDPLDVTYDGVPLRELVTRDELRRRRECRGQYGVTPAQSAAISAHWSAQLRAKVAASADRERARVLVDLQEIE